MKQRFFKRMASILVGLALVACGSTGNNSGHSRKGDANGIYRVKSGDTLVLIARANGVSYKDLMRWNGLSNPDVVRVGWRLRVKGNASGSSNTSSSAASRPPAAQVNGSSTLGRELSTDPVLKNNISWLWPTTGAVLKNFDGAANKGIVLAGKLNDDVLAASAGEVIYAGNGLRGYGNMVVINHNDTWSSVYANNSSVLVAKGDKVSAGQLIAKMGSSDASSVQLYFEVRLNAKPINPLKVLPARGQ